MVLLWWWTPRGPYCRKVLREDLPELQAVLAVHGVLGLWVTETHSRDKSQGQF